MAAPASASSPTERAVRSGLLGSLLAVLAIALFLAIGAWRPPIDHLWGDEGTYVAMAASLVRDGDLRFAEADREWALARDPERPVTVILHRTDNGIFYSKPLLFPLLAAPFYALGGVYGIVAFNAVALAAALLLGWVFLRRLGPRGPAWLTLVSFAALSTLLPYVLWKMSEPLQAALALAGVVLCCGGLRGESSPKAPGLLDRPWAPLLGGIALAVLTSLRTPNAALALGCLLALAAAGKWRRAVAVLLALLVTLGVVAGASAVLLGTADPYTAARTSFNGITGYPVAGEDPENQERFAERPATHRPTRLAPEPTRSLYSALYFVIGRHSGLLAYFPLALLLLVWLARRLDRVAAALLAGVGVLVLFYLVWMPGNYFGGSTFLGNRYFLVAYPALLVALPALPPRRLLAAAWVIGLLAGASALSSVVRTSAWDPSSQSHASAGLFRRLPYESTAQAIGGQAGRFWSRDYVRFVDHAAVPRRWDFTLRADRPPTELMLVTQRPDQPMHLLVTSDAPEVRLIVTDWGRRTVATLTPRTTGSRSLLSLDLSRAWRRHSFPWQPDELYSARTVRLAIDAMGDETATARVRYLGDGKVLQRGFAREAGPIELPTTAVAGRRSTLRVRATNTGPIPWTRDAVLPVELNYRLVASDGSTSTGSPRPIDTEVARGETLDVELDIEWPAQPGRYTLVVDLLRSGLAWFAERDGQPLASGAVEVVEE